MKNNLIYQYYVLNPKSRTPNQPEFVDYSLKDFQKYALMHGVEHTFVTEQFLDYGEFEVEGPLYECLRVIYDTTYDQYDDILIVDGDILINNFYENIFDEDYEDVMVAEWNIPRGKGQFIQKMDMFDIPHKGKETKLWNAGMIMMTKEARLKAREEFIYWQDWINHFGKISLDYDEFYLIAMFLKCGFNTKYCSDKWNWFGDITEGNFVHFGHHTRQNMLKEIVKEGVFNGRYL